MGAQMLLVIVVWGLFLTNQPFKNVTVRLLITGTNNKKETACKLATLCDRGQLHLISLSLMLPVIGSVQG